MLGLRGVLQLQALFRLRPGRIGLAALGDRRFAGADHLRIFSRQPGEVEVLLRRFCAVFHLDQLRGEFGLVRPLGDHHREGLAAVLEAVVLQGQEAAQLAAGQGVDRPQARGVQVRHDQQHPWCLLGGLHHQPRHLSLRVIALHQGGMQRHAWDVAMGEIGAVAGGTRDLGQAFEAVRGRGHG